MRWKGNLCYFLNIFASGIRLIETHIFLAHIVHLILPQSSLFHKSHVVCFDGVIYL